ncbi:uncharacterized protein LOC120250238 [Dioscorea cayenensis subsp. rotundata]|uniref:Uncharacterized protein LOC120250238 n=1 Tax=Dioscorea cayennensis subsp. rotundata TaxID=55577 RepID=A0AB40AJG6_DIOCR|nr:uncharacterized protein LOC120250238 [Dioscorea cayenensis subsp. rotundata]
MPCYFFFLVYLEDAPGKELSSQLRVLQSNLKASSTSPSPALIFLGGRVLDQYQSSPTLDIVEALICGRDWLHASMGCHGKMDFDDGVDDMLKGDLVAQTLNEASNEIEID